MAFTSQEKYVEDLLSRAALTNHCTIDTPMELGGHLRASDGEPLADPTRYRHFVGSLVYLGITHPDISHVVHILSLSLLLLGSTTFTFFVFFNILVEPSLADCSSPAPTLSTFSHIIMRPGLAITLIVVLSTYCVFFGSSLIAKCLG